MSEKFTPEENREKQKNNFLEVLQNLDFQIVTTEMKLKEATVNPKRMPKRASFDNIIQEQYERILPNGDKITIHTSIIGEKFALTGAPWITAEDHRSGKTIFIYFFKNDYARLLFRLAACAQLLGIIFKNRPIGENTLVEKSHDVFVWRSSEGDFSIDFNRYAKYLPKNERDYLTKRFKRSEKWIKDNPHRTRRRNIRSKFKSL